MLLLLCAVVVLAWGSAQLHCFCSVSDTKVANLEVKGTANIY